MTLIAAFIMAVVGSAICRWRGSAWSYRPFSHIAFALPYAAFCIPPATPSWCVPAIVMVLTTLAVLTGHGNFFLRGAGGEDERTEFLIKWLKPHMPLYGYRTLGMSMTGMLITLPAGVALMNPIIAISGVLKGSAYVLSDKAGWDTEGGEWLTGALLWGVLAVFV